MKTKTNWYWKQKLNKHTVIISTRAIFHSCIDVLVIKYVADIRRIICNKKQAEKNLQQQPICIYDAYHDYILDEIMRRDHIEYE